MQDEGTFGLEIFWFFWNGPVFRFIRAFTGIFRLFQVWSHLPSRVTHSVDFKLGLIGIIRLEVGLGVSIEAFNLS